LFIRSAWCKRLPDEGCTLRHRAEVICNRERSTFHVQLPDHGAAIRALLLRPLAPKLETILLASDL
jgi:hypothetical protein